MPRPDIIDPLGNFGLFTIWAPNGANDHRPVPVMLQVARFIAINVSYSRHLVDSLAAKVAI